MRHVDAPIAIHRDGRTVRFMGGSYKTGHSLPVPESSTGEYVDATATMVVENDQLKEISNIRFPN